MASPVAGAIQRCAHFDAAVLGERCEIRDNWLLTRSETSHKFFFMHDV